MHALGARLGEPEAYLKVFGQDSFTQYMKGIAHELGYPLIPLIHKCKFPYKTRLRATI